jgi:NAD+ diphosphatase
MSISFDDVPLTEPSALTGFSGNRLERDSENRTDDSAAKALDHPQAVIHLMAEGRFYLRFNDGVASADFARDEALALGGDPSQAVLLGRNGEKPVLAMRAGVLPDDLDASIKAIDYRSVYVQELVSSATLGALAQGAALLAWHHNHRFCGRCGSEGQMGGGGVKRVCPNCSTEHFPRTDPVAIMLAVQGERCLMGRGAHFGPGMYSCLAGFIESGETIEAAVRRETLEESGITLGRVRYHASQPWPFPYSLMIGCHGEALSDTIAFDGKELEDCRWFARGEVIDMLNGDHAGGLILPPKGAIAWRLLKDWAGD